ncbi:MAG TPA: HAD-IIIC family phosphatase [Vicinamibacterales bacterium]|nr:HAD-IIIC family phosphatase [Vicinamibacterales bacterium]
MSTRGSRATPGPMPLADALRLAAANPPAPAGGLLRLALVCGFTPMHLQTFLCAQVRLLYPDRRIEIAGGLYDDIPGTLQRCASERYDAVVLVLEWADLDPRLGLRRLGGWSPSISADIVERAAAALSRCERLAAAVAASSPVVVSLPTLPLPPLFSTANWQASAHELRLRAHVAAFAAALAGHARIRIVSAQTVDGVSPASERLDVKTALTSGFPYRTAHASRLAEVIARAVQNRPPKKGLITDLDNTLWRGIVGEDGPANVSWDLDHGSQAHGIYQQFLRALAEEGVLVAVASKNDPAVVDEAFARGDLALTKDHVYPLAVGWGSKAQAVSRVLEAWNVHADSVVFVDDSPLELADVSAAHPAIECVQFPANDARAVYDLIVRLRDTFGRAAVSEDDRIRAAGLRARAVPSGSTETGADAGEGCSESVLEQADPELTLDFHVDAGDARALELVNKTNQFNLNGRRFTEREWSEYLAGPHAFLLTASYRDRFGPLGKIAVMAGRVNGTDVLVDTWVMSCRAFARRIEHQCLKAVFARFNAAAVTLDYRETPRNGPITQCLRDLIGAPPSPGATVTAGRFASVCPALPHRVIVRDERGDERYASAAR